MQRKGDWEYALLAAAAAVILFLLFWIVLVEGTMQEQILGWVEQIRSIYFTTS